MGYVFSLFIMLLLINSVYRFFMFLLFCIFNKTNLGGGLFL